MTRAWIKLKVTDLRGLLKDEKIPRKWWPKIEKYVKGAIMDYRYKAIDDALFNVRFEIAKDQRAKQFFDPQRRLKQ